MSASYLARRAELLSSRLNALAPSIERARQAVYRLETAQVPAGAVAGARAAQLAAAKTMVATLEERQRQLRIAVAALRTENTD
ncbi:MAG: hypothetical protein OHK0015_54530 [Chloroflexi bacterium OHK40]